MRSRYLIRSTCRSSISPTFHWLELFRAGGSEANAQYNLGVGLELTGATEAATTAYQAAITARPDHGPALKALKRLGIPIPPVPKPEASP